MRRVSSAAFNVYLLRRLRSRAGAMERARVARELHDGVLQSLIALEMQVDVLRRNEAGRLAEELGPLQHLLHNEILNVRELMQAMRPVEIEPHQFLDFAADTVQRFQRETGISARFISELDEVWLAPRTARELARILQEALVNVRKHACARHVIVKFGSELGRWKLSIDDDGQGFDFAGRFEQKQLDQTRRGPAIIKERLRAIQGELAVESWPGEGARIEISLPQKTYG
jgi:signal transduction histidine kinase